MKFMMCTIFSILLFSGEGVAGTVSTLRDVGFSADGRYFSFTTTENDGMSDISCRTTTFINTVRNEWVGRPYRVCRYGGGEYSGVELRKRQRQSADARSEIKRLTNKLKIDVNNDGKRVVYREAFRYWKNSGSADAEFSKKGESITFSIDNNNRYRLQLSKKTVSSKKCEGMMFNHPPAVMSLHMRNLQTDKSTALQVDRGIPTTRGCPYHYRIQNVYTHQRGSRRVVVALLQYFSPSIEGPDERYLAVSGQLN